MDEVTTSEPVLAVVRPSGVRRGFAVSVLTLLGGLQIYVALATPPANWLALLLLLVLGGLALTGAEVLRRATSVDLELTGTELRDSRGRRLAAVADVVGVERGALAFKPSNGFLVRLSRGEGRHWAPGLWWRVGRRIGVGGVTSAAECKVMAETLGMMVAERDGTRR